MDHVGSIWAEVRKETKGIACVILGRNHLQVIAARSVKANVQSCIGFPQKSLKLEAKALSTAVMTTPNTTVTSAETW